MADLQDDQIVRIPNGVGLGRFSPPRTLSEDKTCYRLLFLERLDPHEGLFMLLEGLAEVAPRFPGTWLLIAGDGARAAALHALAAGLGLTAGSSF